MDWPNQDVQFEAFYCLVLGAAPIGPQTYSPYAMWMSHSLQWVWMLMGTDVQEGIRGRNRGDRYRTHHTMEQELLAALYPYYTQKKIWSLDGNGALQSAVTDPPESITWTPPIFRTRIDQPSGLTYGSASTELTDMTEVVAA